MPILDAQQVPYRVVFVLHYCLLCAPRSSDCSLQSVGSIVLESSRIAQGVNGLYQIRVRVISIAHCRNCLAVQSSRRHAHYSSQSIALYRPLYSTPVYSSRSVLPVEVFGSYLLSQRVGGLFESVDRVVCERGYVSLAPDCVQAARTRQVQPVVDELSRSSPFYCVVALSYYSPQSVQLSLDSPSQCV